MTEIINTAFYQTKNLSSNAQNTPMTLNERIKSLFFDLAGKVIPAETQEARHEALKKTFNQHGEYLKPESFRVNQLRKYFEEKVINVDQLEQRADVAKQAIENDKLIVEFNNMPFNDWFNKQIASMKPPNLQDDNWGIDDEEKW
ncbi:hypothetical protein [Candidatus Regiella endosymbiont of Tuberolachnus salignus]|uniref:hypothetical protein n=1 Tax=Candidatus Regiella endosymbiont of Tuberolachnus salignus TaxID=3077956 RepID=UPI0030D2E53F